MAPSNRLLQDLFTALELDQDRHTRGFTWNHSSLIEAPPELRGETISTISNSIHDPPETTIRRSAPAINLVFHVEQSRTEVSGQEYSAQAHEPTRATSEQTAIPEEGKRSEASGFT